MPRYKIAPLRTRSGEVRMGLRHADSGQFAEEAAGQAPVDASAFDDPEPSLADEAADLGARIAADPAAAGELEVEVRDLGARIVARAEEISGVDADALAARIAERTAAAERAMEPLWAAREATRKAYFAARKEGAPPGELRVLWKLAAEAERAADSARYRFELDGTATDEDKAEMERLREGCLAAVAEVRDMGGTHGNWAPGSTTKARSAFEGASRVYPRDWIDASDAAGQMMARAQQSRAHYLHGEVATRQEAAKVAFRLPRLAANPVSVSESPEEPPLSSLRCGPRPAPVPWGDRRTTKQAGTGWVKDGDVWREVIFEGPSERHLRGAVAAGGPRPKGDGWVWRQATGHRAEPGTGFWHRPIIDTTAASKRESRIAEIKTSSDPSKAHATAIHELAHRAEYTVPGISELEQAFLDRRWAEAGVAGDRPRDLYPSRRGREEVGRDAGFIDPYVGKIYDYQWRTNSKKPDSDRKSHEVLSMGMEALFGGSRGGLVGSGRSKADPDHRAFVLGVLATAGRRAQ